MRHYEIVFLVHPDQSDQTQSILDKFSSIVEGSGGKVHRLENIGSKKLSYPIQDQFKASYGLLNIECNKEALEEIKNFFNFNDSIIRELVLSVNKAYKEVSALSSQTDQEEEDPFSDSTDLKKSTKASPASVKAKDNVLQEDKQIEKKKEEDAKTDKEALKEEDAKTDKEALKEEEITEQEEESTEKVNEEKSETDKKTKES